MNACLRRLSARIVACALPLACLTGCWDNQEIDELFIVTGIALDMSDKPDETDITVQIANLSQSGSGSGGSSQGGSGGGSGESSVILLKKTSATVEGGLSEINRDSNQELMLSHNQVLLFGAELAENGLRQHLDMFLRGQQSRLEVALMVVDGRAEEVLTAKLAEEPITGIYLEGMSQGLLTSSLESRVRLIDFISSMLSESASPVIPIIQVTGEEDKQEIQLAGMGVFKDDRMIGRLTHEETLGFLLAMGQVQRLNFQVVDGSNRVVFHIAKMNCKRKVTPDEDGGIRVSLSVLGNVSVRELRGYSDQKPQDLMQKLESVAQQEIARLIIAAFETARSMNADILGLGTTLYEKYPDQWEAMKDQWDEKLKNAQFTVEARVHVPDMGHIIQNLEMEQEMEKNED